MSLKQPVQYPVKYYSHADADAPQLADADGVIKTILKACLVTGYGTKEGAGWTALFEDDYRIVLRRPLGTGNPPDIKIENGVINGTASHRIVSQDNPTGLDDTTELAAVNLLARDSQKGVEWHMVVSDFGFVLCYQMGSNFSGDRNSILYCGSAQQIGGDAINFYATSNVLTSSNGTASGNMGWFFNANSRLKNMRTNVQISNDKPNILKLDVAERQLGGDYLAQPIMLQTFDFLPFYMSASKRNEDKTTKNISIENRPMLRFVNIVRPEVEVSPFYIPLDYWEL